MATRACELHDPFTGARPVWRTEHLNDHSIVNEQLVGGEDRVRARPAQDEDESRVTDWLSKAAYAAAVGLVVPLLLLVGSAIGCEGNSACVGAEATASAAFPYVFVLWTLSVVASGVLLLRRIFRRRPRQ